MRSSEKAGKQAEASSHQGCTIQGEEGRQDPRQKREHTEDERYSKSELVKMLSLRGSLA